MDSFDFLTGPFSRVVLALSCFAILYRVLLFWRSFREDWGNDRAFLPYALSVLGRRWALPDADAVAKKPVFVVNRYLFHFCLIATPLGVAGHVSLLEDSLLGFSWPVLPHSLLVGMSILVLLFILWVLGQRVFRVKSGNNAQKSGYILTCLTGIAFMTALLMASGWLDYDITLSLHMLGGGALLLVASLMVCCSTADPDKCVGCDACVLSCPTAALEANNHDTERSYSYLHHRCLYCASCVATCPEGAVTLRHGIGLKTHYRRKATIDRSCKLELCEVCSTPFATQAQLDQINSLALEEEHEIETLKICERCKKRRVLTPLNQLHPRTETQGHVN